jgi:hypothetical protein
VPQKDKHDAKEKDGGKAKYELFAVPIKQGSFSIADTKFMRIEHSRQQKDRNRMWSLDRRSRGVVVPQRQPLASRGLVIPVPS